MDKVQVLKRESSALGGDSADEEDLPTPIEPQEDAIEAAGVFLQSATERDEQVYVSRDVDNNLISRDPSLETDLRLVDQMFIRKVQDRNVTIPAGFIWLRRRLSISLGVRVKISLGAELKII